MNNTLEVKFELGKKDKYTVVYIYGLCKVKVDDVFKIHFNRKNVEGDFIVSKIIIKELRNLESDDYQDILPKNKYPTLSSFWSRMESAYKTGIPGDAKISIIYLEPVKDIIELKPDTDSSNLSTNTTVVEDDTTSVNISSNDPTYKTRPYRKNKRRGK